MHYLKKILVIFIFIVRSVPLIMKGEMFIVAKKRFSLSYCLKGISDAN